MRKYIIFLACILFIMSYASTVQGETYQDRYLEAVSTYKNVTPARYNEIYKDRWMDASSKRVWVDAARDYCKNNGHVFIGPNNKISPFDCTDFPKSYR